MLPLTRISVLTLAGLCLLFLFMAHGPGHVSFADAKEKTIVVDEKNPPKKRKLRPSKHTKVISIKGDKAIATDDDICLSLKEYYCLNVGRHAVLIAEEDEWLEPGESEALPGGGRLYLEGFTLGIIKGVAWRAKGQPLGQYLPHRSKFEWPIDKYLKVNHPSPADSFYYIIDSDWGPLMVEPHRIKTGE